MKDINILTFNEFCYSKVYDLIDFMNSQPTLINYDVILIAQNRDNASYKTDKVRLEGYHEKNITDGTGKTSIHDSYYKCSGFIYDRTKVTFNLELSNRYITHTIKSEKNNNNDTYVFTKIDRLLNINLFPPAKPDIDLGTRNLHVISRFDYVIPSKDISPCILQYCAFACFRNISNNKDFTLFNPHFIEKYFINSQYSPKLDYNPKWGNQFTNILEFIESMSIDNYIIIGDFNIRYFDKERSQVLIPTEDKFKSDTKIKFNFSLLKTYNCGEKNICENTCLIVSNFLETSNLCEIFNLTYSCHKPIQITLSDLPQSAAAAQAPPQPAAQAQPPAAPPQPAAAQPQPPPAALQSEKRMFSEDIKIKKKSEKEIDDLKKLSYQDIKKNGIIIKPGNTLNNMNFFNIFERIYDIQPLTNEQKFISVKKNIRGKVTIGQSINPDLFTKLTNDLLHRRFE
jgi:hypothetical protein